jgi:hypothetical protein
LTTFHDLFVMTGEYSTAEFRQKFTALAREAAARSDLIIAISEFTARQTSELLGYPRDRIRVAPHGVDAPAELPAVAGSGRIGGIRSGTAARSSCMWAPSRPAKM